MSCVPFFLHSVSFSNHRVFYSPGPDHFTVYQISVTEAAGFLVLIFYATETEENLIPFLNYNSPQPGS